MLAFVAAPSASAQVSRIALETRHCQHENYVNVYEYDFVDFNRNSRATTEA